jgi:hypothetical protein
MSKFNETITGIMNETKSSSRPKKNTHKETELDPADYKLAGGGRIGSLTKIDGHDRVHYIGMINFTDKVQARSRKERGKMETVDRHRTMHVYWDKDMNCIHDLNGFDGTLVKL